MSLLQDYLRNNGSLEKLKTDYSITSTRHKTYPNLVLLKYNQFDSPFELPIVREARGIILDEDDNWNVVCARFKKFGNYGEAYAAPINFGTSKVTLKEDGSLITIYNYKGIWHCATSGTPDAACPVGDFGFTFAELFWRVFNAMGLRLPNDTDLCPSFELMTPWNSVVIPHKEDKLVFIGLHDRSTGEELPLETLSYYPAVKTYDIGSFDEVLEIAKGLNGFEQEGFVLTDMANKRDGDFSRVKIKGDDYVARHHLKSSWSVRKAVEVVLKNEIAEIINYFPAFTDQLNDIKKRYDLLVKHLMDTYAEIQSIENKKEFALALQARKPLIPGALYMLHSNKTYSIHKYLADMNIRNLVEVMGLKDSEEVKAEE